MANIKARKSKDGRITSYQIRVFRGLDAYGKQIMVTETYKVPSHGTRQTEQLCIASTSTTTKQASTKSTRT